jgi:ubiquinone biosynthesis UbiH/UbiF/VisC/COQ6 family hydroxylase
MQAALWRAIESQGDVCLFSQAQCASLAINEQSATLTLSDGQALQAHLIVGADGGHSWIRQQAGINTTGHEYGQLGVVANFITEKPHGNIARQWFRRDGILAWLPLPGNRMSMVWSTFQQNAQALLALDAQALCGRVAEAGEHALGALELITPAAGFPLRLQNAVDVVKPRLALIGDAAHLVHPLAGQGVNLGFHDAEKLAQALIQRGARADVGDVMLLRRYARASRGDVVAMQTVTDGLQKLFNNDKPLLAMLRNVGLGVVNRQGWLKRHLMAHAVN